MKLALMIWGTSSGAGKSLLATALCRWAARDGLDVAPFKAQNMSNNARVIPAPDGGVGEIGSAQYFQALAARVAPQIDMNPVLLKPERDTASQVVVHGHVEPELSRQLWRERSATLAERARASFDRLAATHDLIVIEGAGSPAEINLAGQDYVNLETARWARHTAALRALLVVDIDRGGAFAHLYGTWSFLPTDLRPALAGFVLNKFRGDPALLAPGPQMLCEATGVPVLGTLPMRRDHGLPEEDGVQGTATRASTDLIIAIIAWPHLSNLDEFQPLAGVGTLRWARVPADLHGAHWIILPGSKQVSGDLAWLHAQGMAAPIVAHARLGRPVLGICGGMQVLGRRLEDPDGVDGEPHAAMSGLGLLPLTTRYAVPKRLRAASIRFERLTGHWEALSHRCLPAYEIRCGRTDCEDPTAAAVLLDAEREPIGWQLGAVLGIATHGLFEDAGVLRALFGAEARTLDAVFDGLADLVAEQLGASTLRALVEPAAQS